MADLKASWTYPLTEAKGTKALPRTGTPTQPGACFDLVGVDASMMGGLRPHPGFKLVHTIGGIEANTRIIDIRAFDIQAGAEDYAYGFIYTTDNLDGTANLLVDFRIGENATWTTTVLQTISSSARIDVTLQGRFVFVAVSGEAPVLFFIDPSISSDPIVVGNPGAGKRPKLIPPDQSLGFYGIESATGYPAWGQILLTDTVPSELGTYVGAVPQEDSAVRALASGDYAFAFRLYNSLTGRWSGLSTIAPVQSADFTEGSSSSSTTTTAKYAVLDLLWQKTSADIVGMDAWDYCIIYRSVRVQSIGGLSSAAILHADRLFKLEDFEVTEVPDDTDYRRSVCWYELEDKALIFGLPYNDSATFEEFMPEGSVCLGYEGTLLLSGIRNTASTPQLLGQGPSKGLGEIRWSSLVELSPELFPPFNRYVPQTPSNEVIRFIKATGQAIGFSRDRQYHIRKESIYLRIMEMHEGYGLVTNRGAATVGSLCYFLTPKGVKVVDPQGQMESLKTTDFLMLETWKDTLDSVQFAYDAYTSVLYMVNTELEQSVLVWFNTSTMTELYDTNFQHCFEGSFPFDPDDETTALVNRAFFLGSLGRIYVVDATRSKVVAGVASGNGLPRQTLMDIQGDTLLRSSQISFVTATTVVTTGVSMHSSMIGAKAYVVDAATKAFIGSSATITNVTGNTLVFDDATLFTDASVIAISPVFVRWTGYQLGLQNEQGETFGPRDMHQIRHVEGMLTNFSNVGGRNADFDETLYFGLLYRSNDSFSVARARAYDTSGDAVPDGMIKNYETLYGVAFGADDTNELTVAYGYDGTVLFPSIEIFIPDIDYRLLSVKVHGRIRDSERRALPQ